MPTTKQQQQTLQRWIGHDLIDETGHKIGRIEEVYTDQETNKPEWLAVTTGMFGNRTSFVPLQGVTSSEDCLVSPWDKAKVKDAPNAEADGHLSQEEEAALYRHYGLQYSERRSDSGLPDGGKARADQGRETRSDQGRETRSDQGHDTSGPNTDTAMTRSEEEMRVDTTQHETGRARLRKWVETEHQTVTVPVRKERVEVVREPITEGNRGAAMSGPDISEEEHEVVLTEEQAVVDTQVVPKERVRLQKEVDTDDEQVSADLRKERIEVEGDADQRSRR